jgi:hypothetical protein
MLHRLLVISLFFLIGLNAIAQKNKWYAFEEPTTKDGKEFCGRKMIAKFYSKMLNDTTWGDTIKGSPVIDEEQVIVIAQEGIFKKYGEKHYKKEMPYEIYLINGFWLLMGTLPEGYMGGTIHVLIKAKNGAVLDIWADK